MKTIYTKIKKQSKRISFIGLITLGAFINVEALAQENNMERRQYLQIADAPIGQLDYGVGFNWFDFLGVGGYYGRWEKYSLKKDIYPSVDDKASWDLIFKEFDYMQPGFIRFGIPPQGILDKEGKLIKDNVHFKRLALISEWCAKNDRIIILDPFLIPEQYGFPDRKNNPFIVLNMAPGDNKKYAEKFVAPLLDHIVNELGLKAVKMFNPVNEPDHYGAFLMPEEGPDYFEHYVDMYKEMRTALDAIGLTEDKMGLVGIDKDMPFDFPIFEYMARGIDINPYVANYSIHSYRSRFDHAPESADCPGSDPLNTLVDKWIKRIVDYTHARGKYLLACEVGAFYYGQRTGDEAGPATPEGTLLTIETIIRMINVGVRGALIWSPMNPNDIDGWWRMFDVKDGKVSHELHSYPAYAILMRAAQKDSNVYPIISQNREYPQYVWGTMFEGSNQSSLLLINDHPIESRNVEIKVPDFNEKNILKSTKDRVRSVVEQPTEDLKEDVLKCSLPPMSVTVYSIH